MSRLFLFFSLPYTKHIHQWIFFIELVVGLYVHKTRHEAFSRVQEDWLPELPPSEVYGKHH